MQLNTIYAGADGKFEAAPDTALLRFDIAAQASTAHAAYARAAAVAERMRQVLQTNGIDAKSAQIGFYSVQPMYDWKSPKRRVVGYEVFSSVSLKLHDFSKIGSIVEQTSSLEDTENQSLSYVLENMEEAKQKAAEDALKKARDGANAIAAAGGRSLGELLYASMEPNQPVIAAPREYGSGIASAASTAAAMPAPTERFTPHTVVINAHVNAMFALK
jgi:uncharacterized protein YggE